MVRGGRRGVREQRSENIGAKWIRTWLLWICVQRDENRT